MDDYPRLSETRGELAPYRPPAWQRGLTLALPVVAALYFLWTVRSVLPPFLIAFFLAALLDPVVSNMERRGLTRGRAVLAIYAMVFLWVVLALILVIPAAMDQVSQLSRNAEAYGANIARQSDTWYEQNQRLLNGIGIKQNPLRDRSGPVAQAAASFLAALQASALALTGQVLWLILIPLTLYFLLMEYGGLRAKILSLFPTRQQAHLDKISQEIVEIFSTYFRSLAKVCVLYGAAAGIIFYLLGLKYSLFLGIAAGVLYAVPYVGPLVTVVSAAIIALMMSPVVLAPTSITFSPVAHAVIVVTAFLVMHFTFDYGITPKLVGGSVGLHPVVNIFALMCGATIFGVWGMLLAVPVAASIQMMLIYFFPKLGQKPPSLAPAAFIARTPDESTHPIVR
jgi:predicted PurR-regulated permease PerM